MTVNRREFLGAAAVVPLLSSSVKVADDTPLVSVNPKNLPVVVADQRRIVNWRELLELGDEFVIENLPHWKNKTILVWLPRDYAFCSTSKVFWGECALRLHTNLFYFPNIYIEYRFSTTKDTIKEDSLNLPSSSYLWSEQDDSQST